MFKQYVKNKKFYNVHLQQNLFGGTSVICSWGSFENNLGGHRTIFCQKQEQIDATIDEIAKRRKYRGYTLNE